MFIIIIINIIMFLLFYLKLKYLLGEQENIFAYTGVSIINLQYQICKYVINEYYNKSMCYVFLLYIQSKNGFVKGPKETYIEYVHTSWTAPSWHNIPMEVDVFQ